MSGPRLRFSTIVLGLALSQCLYAHPLTGIFPDDPRDKSGFDNWFLWGALSVLAGPSAICRLDHFGAIRTNVSGLFFSELQAARAAGGTGTPTVDTTTVTGLTGAWQGVLAPNGKIYTVPNSQPNVMIIDTQIPATDTTTLSGLTSAWSSSVLALNGKIYALPGTASSIMILDPKAAVGSLCASVTLSGYLNHY